MSKKGIIVVSGGVDSITLLYDKREEIGLALTFRYGSNHESREVPCAEYHCKQLGIEHRVVDLDFVKSDPYWGVCRGEYAEYGGPLSEWSDALYRLCLC